MAERRISRLVGLTLVAEGRHAQVRLSTRAAAEFERLKAGKHGMAERQFRQLERYMQQFCDTERPSLPIEQFRKEGSYSDGRGSKVAIYAFKPFQWRLYGAILDIEGQKCFVGVRVDPEKKQDRADKELLESAARDIGQLYGYVKGRP